MDRLLDLLQGALNWFENIRHNNPATLWLIAATVLLALLLIGLALRFAVPLAVVEDTIRSYTK